MTRVMQVVAVVLTLAAGTGAAGGKMVDADAIRALHAALPQVPRVLLLEPRAAAQWMSEQGLKELKTFATGVALFTDNPAQFPR